MFKKTYFRDSQLHIVHVITILSDKNTCVCVCGLTIPAQTSAVVWVALKL